MHWIWKIILRMVPLLPHFQNILCSKVQPGSVIKLRKLAAAAGGSSIDHAVHKLFIVVGHFRIDFLPVSIDQAIITPSTIVAKKRRKRNDCALRRYVRAHVRVSQPDHDQACQRRFCLWRRAPFLATTIATLVFPALFCARHPRIEGSGRRKRREMAPQSRFIGRGNHTCNYLFPLKIAPTDENISCAWDEGASSTNAPKPLLF